MPFCLKHSGVGEVALVEGVKPVPEEGQILVKVVAVGGNPVDRELNKFPGLIINTTIGYDFAGTVVSLGPGVTRFKPGDRVATSSFGALTENLDWGAFAEYAIGFEHVAFAIPDGMSFEEAATLPSALVVSAMGLYMDLQLAAGEGVFIAGGSSTMGNTAVQIAKAIGACPIVASASPKNFDLVKSLGADHVVDYNDPDFVQQIKKLTNNKLTKVFDAFSTGDSPAKSSQCFGDKGGTLVLLNPTETDNFRSDVEYKFLNSFVGFGLPFKIFGYDVSVVPLIKDFVANWFLTVAAPLIAEGKIKPHGVKIMPGGFNAVKAGWDLYRDGKVSGEKLIYRVADTEGIQA